MKNLVLFGFLILFTFIFSCERDDICPESTPTTPKLIITFKDLIEQDNVLFVSDLSVFGEDMQNEPYFASITTDSISIPLKTDAIETTFSFIKDSEYDNEGNLIAGNVDILTFTYNPTEVYVSRACGYKTIFENLEANLEIDSDNWIEQITIEDPLTVDNETTTHVQIFHQ